MSLCIDNSFDIIVIICGLSPAIVELYFTDNETQSQGGSSLCDIWLVIRSAGNNKPYRLTRPSSSHIK